MKIWFNYKLSQEILYIIRHKYFVNERMGKIDQKRGKVAILI